jgi:GNAT superfamily N-acetyltransferase
MQQHPSGVSIELLTRDRHETVLPGLAEVLVDSVDSGASVGFLRGLAFERALSWWRTFLADASMATWIASDSGGVAGVVGLQVAEHENAPHRADVRMLLVHRRARGQGVARALLAVLEREAMMRGRWLLVLDTETGSAAETVYTRLGWQRAGVVPDHTLDPSGAPAGTTFFWKRLSTEER